MRWLIGWLLVVSLVFATIEIAAPASAHESIPISADEQEVLDILVRHPDVIFNALLAYRDQQLAAAATADRNQFVSVRQNLSAFIGSAPIRGSSSAPITLIEFADFECPFCLQAHQPVLDLLKRHPQVRFVFKHLPLTTLHPQAIIAARAAWAAGAQGKFWAFYDGLFSEDKPLEEQRYQALAQQIGLNLKQWERDRQSLQAQQAIERDITQASQLEFNGTPSFLVVTPSEVVPIVGADLAAIEQSVVRALL
jgi:protein-disulfide isomerase